MDFKLGGRNPKELFIFCHKLLFFKTNFKEETDYKLYKNNQSQTWPCEF